MVSTKEPSSHVTLGILPNGTSALRLLAAHDLRLHAEDFQPQAKVRLDAEEGLAHDDERRDVEDEIRAQIVKI